MVLLQPQDKITIQNAFTYSQCLNIQFLPDNPPTLEIFLNHFNNSSSLQCELIISLGLELFCAQVLFLCKNTFNNGPHYQVRKKAKIRNPYNEIPHLRPRTPYGKVTKTQENITYKRAKRSAHSQQVTTRLQGTDKTV